MSKHYSSAHSGQLLMKVYNLGFLLDRLGEDCDPLQFIRELTQNSIQAILRTGKPGQIIWDVDTVGEALEGVKRLSITDTGDGMTGDDLVKYINQLSSSVTEQSLDGNYGVGAKISACTRNHAGVVYTSWKQGVEDGHMIHLFRDPKTKQYGLKQHQNKSDEYLYVVPIDDDVKPDIIREHGTKVILYGNSDSQNTIEAPQGTPYPYHWISRYLNTRYFEFPEPVKVYAREGWDKPNDSDSNMLRKVTGQRQYLDKYSEKQGTMELDGAVAHWWILKDMGKDNPQRHWYYHTGHTAALYNDELYEHALGPAGTTRLQQFGITFGTPRVFIYIKPKNNNKTKITSNTARTQLLMNNQPLPWHDWANQFRENMPKEVEEFVEVMASNVKGDDYSKSIKDRLSSIMFLFKMVKYKQVLNGSFSIDETSAKDGGLPAPKNKFQSTGNSSSGGSGGSGGSIYALFSKPQGPKNANEIINKDDFPEVKWVSVVDGSRTDEGLEDRAAKYIPETNIIFANADFRGFTDIADKISSELRDIPNIKMIVKSKVEETFAQVLVETVIGVQQLKKSKYWSNDDIEQAYSPVALTSSVMQRYYVYQDIRRKVGSKTGGLKAHEEKTGS